MRLFMVNADAYPAKVFACTPAGLWAVFIDHRRSLGWYGTWEPGQPDRKSIRRVNEALDVYRKIERQDLSGVVDFLLEGA